MAEEDEEIIIIEDVDKTAEPIIDTPSIKIVKKSSKKKIIIIVLIVLLLIIIAITIIIFKKHKIDNLQSILPFKRHLLKKNIRTTITPSQIEKMIIKANYLYNHNNKREALNLYKKVATYNEALSRYNLGVAQLKGKNYKVALITFKKAIKNHEKICMSAINAAVCSLHLHQKENFKYYIDLAYTYLPYETNSPLYSYYYALIKFYKKDYFEALSALKNPDSNDYYIQKQFLKSKINTLFGNYQKAINNFTNPYMQDNALPIGLLYANIGDYALSKKYLNVAIKLNINPLREHLALALVHLKDYNYQSASKEFKNVTVNYPQQVYRPYPITVYLSNIFKNPISAQQYYRHILNTSTFVKYEEIFHFAPYKIFNANNTIKNIKKGNINIYTNDIKNAIKYLNKSKSLSTTNLAILKAIKNAVHYKIITANKILENIKHQKDSILQYNLGLTYAQLGDIQQANKHFTTSYYLDSSNYLSGIFAMMSAKLLYKNNIQFNEILKNNLSQTINNKNLQLYSVLIDLINDNSLGELNWIQNSKSNKPLYLMIKVITANNLHKYKIALSSTKKLKLKLPHDILAQLISINEKLKNRPATSYARGTLFFMQHNHYNFDFNTLYHGSFITRYLYVYQALFTGTLFPLQQQLQIKLRNSPTQSIKGIIYTLALTDLLAKKYEESYTFFNQLIDQYKIKNAKTLFLGAIASIEANHHANATILLELAALKNPNNSAIHYALGLLYLEEKNNLGAVIQLRQIRASFRPSYFNFRVIPKD